MKMGMSTACFFGREKVEDAVTKIGKMGIKLIEIFLNTFGEYERPFIKELKKRLKDFDIKVNSVHPQGVQFEPQMFSSYDRAKKDATDIFKRVLDAASMLGAGITVYHGGLFFKPMGTYSPDIEKVAKVIEHAADLCAERGLKFAYENVHWCWFNSPQYANDLLKHTDHKNLYFNLDIKQAAQSGIDYFEYMKVMTGRIANVHVCDYTFKKNMVKTTLPFRGQVDFKLLKRRLDDVSYDGNVILEVYDKDYESESELAHTFYDSKALFEG